ncbi:MFS transporter [Spongiactinospora gelatinilytica]|uniref:MFS transporter n=2 Tax=Spongiactinospora gelatinilytica TaxID=2666298 RepID=A0A2W2H993_9ACTN|nr:MFS transporter [Spongiactinospora gelatinilytica]
MVGVLAVTQTIGYGVLYYAFSVFLDPMRRDLGADGTQVAAAFTLAVLVTAGCAPLVGRWLDARGGCGLMTAGSVLGAAAVLAWSRVESLPQLYAVFVAIGVASAMALYEPAFAVVVAWFDGQRQANALLVVTIIAGFASSVFLPLAGLLTQAYGWREALVVLALGYGVIAIPAHAVVVRRRGHGRGTRAHTAERAALVHAAVRERPFRLLAAAFTAQGSAVATIGVLLITYLVHLGHRPVFAATVAGLLGVLSVTGRLVTTGLQRRLPAALIAVAIFALQGLAVLLLPFVGRHPAGAIGCVLGFGLGFGVGTIIRPHLLAARYGTTAYGSLSGRIAMFTTAARAGAPLGAMALAQVTDYGWVMVAVAAACAVAAIALLSYHRAMIRRERKQSARVQEDPL